MTWDAASFASLAGIVGGQADEAERHPATDVLLGFDAVVQFSRRMLQAQLAFSVAQLQLRADVPWGTLAVPRTLLARLSAPFINTLPVRESRLELRLVQPQIVSMRWPAEDAATDAEPPSTAMRAATRRVVTVAWRLELSAITARFDQATEVLPNPSAAPAGTGVANVDLDRAATTDLAPSDEGISWARVTFAVGQVALEADARLVSEPDLWRFGMELDFAGSEPTVTADEPALVEFLTSAGRSLLARAVAPLAVADVRLTPQVAPAGPLSSRSVQQFGLPGFQVSDRLLTGKDGTPVLCLCVQLDGASGGVARLVRPFLEVSDFGYAVSTSILGPALKARWKLTAPGVSLAGEMPVEMPAEDGGTQTETWRAQVLSHYADTLDDVSLRSLGGDRGDALLLMGRQTIQLLNLWRENGDRIPDLGQLGEPADIPLTLLFNLAGGPSTASIHQDLRNFLLKLLPVLGYPLLQPFYVNADSFTGFISSPLKTMLLRWRLKTVFDVTVNTDNVVVGRFS